MGGSQSSSKSSFCGCFGSHSCEDDSEWEPRCMSKVRPSDEDRGYWVGDPYVDTKASDFIAKFHQSHFADPETVTV